MPAVTALTIDDFERLPAALAVGHELVEGELIAVSGNTPFHNGLRDCLIEILRPHVRQGRLGRVYAEQEYDFGGNAHGPDVSFFGNDKLPLLDPGKRVQRFVPDLAIEIASPADTHEGLMKKKNCYLRCGVREVWLISPESEDVTIYSAHRNTIRRGADELSTDLIPGLSIVAADLFRQA